MKKQLITVDCGKNNGTIYYGSGKTEIITHKDILNLPETLEPGSLLVGEYAHFGVPRTKKSRAQPFTKEQLLNLFSLVVVYFDVH